ncbi:hypothetical protein SAMN02787144_1006121 [Streptomyces atratus]|uniref:Uncharacterized protein n=1 Tax=Streptomyces atratus TaxID=1893 RepID=A0A1K1ZV75_STRAR|nr:hypothetical protein SAMN02787144_1006121 [Streptomyces atratus]
MWLPVTVVAGLLGAVLLCAAGLVLVATVFLAPLALVLAVAERPGRRPA